MKETPKYLVIGSGRMAKHFGQYLKLLNLPFQEWSRKNNTEHELKKYGEFCSHVLILISDDAIEGFIKEHSFLLTKCCVHFSGRLDVENIFGAHPLMTFGHDLYDLVTYRSIPFILGEEGPGLVDVLPGLSNQEYRIARELRSLYHAVIVMGNNFTTILWQYVFKRLENDLQLPKEVARPILKKTLDNLLENDELSLTGPLVRGDQVTIDEHLKALADDSYKKIYQAFVDVFSERLNKGM